MALSSVVHSLRECLRRRVRLTLPSNGRWIGWAFAERMHHRRRALQDRHYKKTGVFQLR